MLEARTLDVAAQHRPSVLIVDDQPVIRTVLTRTLGAHGGLAIAEAGDGLAALAWIERRHATQRPLDLLVLDIMMPNISGLEVIEALRWTYPTMPRIMVISALDEEEHVAEALRLGAVDYLPKPIDAGMFLHRVLTLCSPSSRDGDFRWAPLARLPEIRMGEALAHAKAISESGVIVEAGPGDWPSAGQVVPLASPVFAEYGIDRRVLGRVVRVTALRGRRTIELSFVGLRERDVRQIRRYSMRR